MKEQQEAITHFTQIYAEVHKKYPSLPSLELLEEEFDILENIGRDKQFPKNAVRYTRWYVLGCINRWIGVLYEVAFPNPNSIVALQESEHYEDKEREEISDLITWNMYCNRSANLLQLDENDNATAEFIIEMWNGWQKRKPHVRTLIEKNRNSWKKKLR